MTAVFLCLCGQRENPERIAEARKGIKTAFRRIRDRSLLNGNALLDLAITFVESQAIGGVLRL
jgi:hypothetical protein